MEFYAQSPADDNIGFDRDDLVGISLLGDDPIFKKGISVENMYRAVVDEAGDIGSDLSSELQSIADAETDEPDLMDIEPDDDELAYDAMDVNDQIEAAHDIFTGEADDDIDILDFVESLPEKAIKEDAGEPTKLDESTDEDAGEPTRLVESVADLESLFGE